jgi:hypothetical protein
LAGALAAVATALVLGTPAVSAYAVRVEPFPNSTLFVGDTLAMATAFCVLAVLAHTVCPVATARRRTIMAAAVLVVGLVTMAALLVDARTRSTVPFAIDHAADAGAVAYESLYAAYMCWCMVSFMWLIRRYACHNADRLMRWSLRINMVAAVVGLAWAAWKVTNAVIAAAGHPISHQGSVSELLGALAVGLIASGVSLPSWATWIAGHAGRRRTRRAYRELAPLWTILVTEVPQVALPGKALRRGIEYALYRRVIEIRDAQRALRPYIDPDVSTRLAEVIDRDNLEPVEANLLTEATELTAGLDGHRAGHRYHADASRIDISRQPTAPGVFAEACWLVRVARTMRQNPLAPELADSHSPQ